MTKLRNVKRGEALTWQKGQSGNPNGRPKGARNRLSESVLSELITHWEEHGRDEIERTCKENPDV